MRASGHTQSGLRRRGRGGRQAGGERAQGAEPTAPRAPKTPPGVLPSAAEPGLWLNAGSSNRHAGMAGSHAWHRAGRQSGIPRAPAGCRLRPAGLRGASGTNDGKNGALRAPPHASAPVVVVRLELHGGEVAELLVPGAQPEHPLPLLLVREELLLQVLVLAKLRAPAPAASLRGGARRGAGDWVIGFPRGAAAGPGSQDAGWEAGVLLRRLRSQPRGSWET